ncbi:hypothetical protein HNR00_004025 [Methylorubrum rhodinum]|uniref:Prohead serine protease domain-containing protein n=1 Tax=Methylorubrum rhodinum TaxID=29428 RepID=A0A840ZRF9_9HYPH|nr:HK97 family phage prohead protease [Methylorubrum rhodinum]MBB5759293.1 hypothetical protein [Methylorubrum rhodinum]
MSDPKTRRRASRVRSDSFDPESYTIEVVWTTGATVRTFDPWTGEEFDEALSLDDGAVNLDRLNAGAAFIDTHDSSECSRVVGSVVRGSARIEGGKGLCLVQLSRARDVADIVLKIREGVIRNVSVGYWVHRYETVEQDGATPLKIATEWEPLEISAVPVPADAGSQIRSARGRRTGARPRPPETDMERGARAAARILGKPVPKREPSASERALAALRRHPGRAREPDPRRVAEREAADRKAGAKAARRLLWRGHMPGR